MKRLSSIITCVATIGLISRYTWFVQISYSTSFIHIQRVNESISRMTQNAMRKQQITKSSSVNISTNTGLPTNITSRNRSTDIVWTTLQEKALNISRMGNNANHKSIMITIVDRAYYTMMLNYNHYAENANVTNKLAISLDAKTHKMLERNNIATYYMEGYENISNTESMFFSPSFKKKGFLKFLVALNLLQRGLSVLVTDVDVIIFRNPFQYFDCDVCDIEAQDNMDGLSGAEQEVCVGFVYFRPTEATILFLEDVCQALEEYPNVWDQGLFNTLAVQHKPSIRLLGYLFPTGRDFFYQHYLNPYAFQDIVIFHNNFVRNTARKIYRAKEFGIWMVDTDGYYSDESRRYLTYSYSNQTHEEELWLVRYALKIAQSLNRTLILPAFRCPGVNQYQCLFKGDCACSLAEVVDIARFDTCYGGLYREHTFLSHPYVPLSIKRGIVNASVSQNTALSNDVKVNVTMRELIDSYSHFPVLNLLNMDDLLPSFDRPNIAGGCSIDSMLTTL